MGLTDGLGRAGITGRQLVAALEHLVVAGLTAEKCHRELELVQLGTDLHPQLTVNYVYQRLAVVTARLQTAREQLEGVVQRAEQAAQLAGGV